MKIVITIVVYSVVVIVYIAATRRMSAKRPALATFTPIFLAALTMLLFGAFNSTNLCNHGWCERYGFPVEYRGWSDATVSIAFNGEEPKKSSPAFAVAVDILVALVASAGAYLAARKLTRRSAGA